MNKVKKFPAALFIIFAIGLALVFMGLQSLSGEPQQLAKVEETPPPQELEASAGQEIAEVVIEEPTLEVQNHMSKVITINSGDTLAGVLEKQGIDRIEVAYAIGEIDDVFDLRKLRAGQEIDISFIDNEGKLSLQNLKFQPSIEELVALSTKEDGAFEAKLEEIPLEKVFVRANGEIQSSFYESTVSAGVTDNVTLQLIAALSFAVDFQREIRPGNKFEILYQAYKNTNGEFIKGRRPVYARLELNHEIVELFVVEDKDGNLSYFHPDGSSVKKGLLRTPINGARISSGYGKRRHPVLGYSKMHSGVDFAAPSGTPIYAAGDGVITKRGRNGSYGNYIKIRHNGTYSTAYAHMKSFSSKLKNGSKVKQGMVIGYVGTTGRSTGPHLHYEVLQAGRQINPQKAKMPVSEKLKGKELATFNANSANILAALTNAPSRSEFASAE